MNGRPDSNGSCMAFQAMHGQDARATWVVYPARPEPVEGAGGRLMVRRAHHERMMQAGHGPHVILRERSDGRISRGEGFLTAFGSACTQFAPTLHSGARTDTGTSVDSLSTDTET